MSDEFNRFLRNTLDTIIEHDAINAKNKSEKDKKKLEKEASRKALLTAWSNQIDNIGVICQMTNHGLSRANVVIAFESTEVEEAELAAGILQISREGQSVGQPARLSLEPGGSQVAHLINGRKGTFGNLPHITHSSQASYEPLVTWLIDTNLDAVTADPEAVTQARHGRQIDLD